MKARFDGESADALSFFILESKADRSDGLTGLGSLSAANANALKVGGALLGAFIGVRAVVR